MSETDGTIFIGAQSGGGAAQALVLKRANRHGLIAGATGTGKTVTLQTLAESLSLAGVPVVLADVKGDLAGISQAGGANPKIAERAALLGIADHVMEANPTVAWDVFGEQGHPIRATVSEMGPLLLARLLELNDVQEGVLNLTFKVADDEGLLLLDLKDLRAMLADSVLSRRTSSPFTDLPASPADTPAERLRTIAGKLRGSGLDILYLDLSPPGGDVFAVKAIVPGLECETMSYHRIGERGIRRLLERGGQLVGIGAPPPGMQAVPLTAAAMDRLGGPAWLDTGAIDRIVGPLYALYREPESHAVRFMLEAAKT